MQRLTEREPYWLGEEYWVSAKEPDEAEIDAVYDKLKDYEDLEELGLMVKLPCKVGDTVWFVPKYNGKSLGFIREDKVQMVGVTARGIHFKLREHHEHNKLYMLGKTVFLTKEEAEAKLREMEVEE